MNKLNFLQNDQEYFQKLDQLQTQFRKRKTQIEYSHCMETKKIQEQCLNKLLQKLKSFDYQKYTQLLDSMGKTPKNRGVPISEVTQQVLKKYKKNTIQTLEEKTSLQTNTKQSDKDILIKNESLLFKNEKFTEGSFIYYNNKTMKNAPVVLTGIKSDGVFLSFLGKSEKFYTIDRLSEEGINLSTKLK
ncbi:hypothetical protein M0812_08972 [Anaeramoeba flamelloides]|uniref:Uncharacterized protein n=1 Tax=Anaeramoeba flamelloides TaxID=1746091 RepID=A0AAV7ZQN7_9EUKA|nr:hypothetical protein M0812_08972 [Anaeramoeba flamelloides]